MLLLSHLVAPEVGAGDGLAAADARRQQRAHSALAPPARGVPAVPAGGNAHGGKVNLLSLWGGRLGAIASTARSQGHRQRRQNRLGHGRNIAKATTREYGGILG